MKDLQLIWDNCKLYNPPDNEFYQMALTMEAFMHEIVQPDYFASPMPLYDPDKKVPKKERALPRKRKAPVSTPSDSNFSTKRLKRKINKQKDTRKKTVVAGRKSQLPPANSKKDG